MASQINASNSGFGGIVSTGDSSGVLQLQTTGTTAVTIDTSQNVGIGTTSPSLPLDIVCASSSYGFGIRAYTGQTASTMKFTSNNGSTSYAYMQGASTYTEIGTAQSTPLVLATNLTERMRIDSSGNVGIGTSSPGAKLNIDGAASDSVALFTNNGTVSAGGNGLRVGIDNSLNAYVNNSKAGPLVFSTSNTERMRIDSSGNVSITQTPGKYTIDTTGGQTLIANGGTVDFPNASGMLVVNNHSNGAVTIWLCGSGNTAAIGSVTAQVGTMAYVAGISGYRWTNNYGSTAQIGFFFVRTRTTA